jgi:transposase
VARPFGSLVTLTPEVRRQLEAIERAGSTPQSLAFRCRIVLRAGQSDDPSNRQIANELACDRHTVGQWRKRFVNDGLAGLQDLPRSGRPRSFSPLATG